MSAESKVGVHRAHQHSLALHHADEGRRSAPVAEAVAMLEEMASALAAATAAWQAQFTLAMAEEAACRGR